MNKTNKIFSSSLSLLINPTTFSLFTFFLSLTHTTSSTFLDCIFKLNPWTIYDSDRLLMNQTESIRYCEVQNKEIFVNFVKLEGCSNNSEDLSKVTGFVFTQGTMNFFPHGVDKIFKSLTAIQVEEAKLREIHVEDLAGFKNLKILYLNSNELKVIEADLFKFNEKLEFIRLDFNQISHIDPQVFSHLVNLKLLALKENFCKINNAIGEEVRNLVKLIEDEKCINYDDLDGVTNVQERILRILSSENENSNENFLKLKIKELETKFENSKSVKEILNSKLENLSNENQNLNEKIQKIQSENENFKNEKLKNLQNLNPTECNLEELQNSLENCKSNLDVKSAEITRLNKIIEQLENSSNKFPWKEILIPSVIGLLTLLIVTIGIIVIIVKINFIIQKLKDQFYNARRPLNVPNDFWHTEE